LVTLHVWVSGGVESEERVVSMIRKGGGWKNVRGSGILSLKCFHYLIGNQLWDLNGYFMWLMSSP
jgi:hypothetical protein